MTGVAAAAVGVASAAAVTRAVAGQEEADAAGWEQQAVETEIKFAGYLAQQRREMERVRKAEGQAIPASFNYTAVLNIVFIAVALILAVRFLVTGGPAMMRMMNTARHSPAEPGSADQDTHHH